MIIVSGPRVGDAIDWSDSKVRIFARQRNTLIPYLVPATGTPFTNITVNDGDGYKKGEGKLLLDYFCLLKMTSEHLVIFSILDE